MLNGSANRSATRNRPRDRARARNERVPRADRQPPPDDAVVSAREREVLLLLAEGCTNADISTRLYLSQETVKSHVRNIMLKLGARTRTHAVVLALDRGLIRTPGSNVEHAG
jgi:DNA-binding NarL/FixJ family response regulator